ncbi:MAG: class I SAM-dependent methyltransferase [Patescibacteria group bacterium]
MITFNKKDKIIRHYDYISPYYRSLWGEHLHHGYWIKGNEKKEEAQLALTQLLADQIEIKRSQKILDIGCGFGASSIYLAKKYGAKTTGITISQVQVDIAKNAAKQAGVNSSFFLMDAEKMKIENNFDILWSIESISHYKNKVSFFKNSSVFLKSEGYFALVDWFKKDDLNEKEYKKYILPIEKGMLVELQTMKEYENYLESTGYEIIKALDISKNVAKTWDISLEIIKNKSFWSLALKNGVEFVNFLKAFKVMKTGFSSGNFVYGVIIAKKK